MSPFDSRPSLASALASASAQLSAAPPARAGRIEALPIFQRRRAVHVARAADRDGLLDVARRGIGVEADVGVRAQRAAHVLEALQTPAARRIGDREEAAVAGAHADRLRSRARFAGIGLERVFRRRVRVQRDGLDVARSGSTAAEQRLEKVRRLRRRGVDGIARCSARSIRRRPPAPPPARDCNSSRLARMRAICVVDLAALRRAAPSRRTGTACGRSRSSGRRRRCGRSRRAGARRPPGIARPGRRARRRISPGAAARSPRFAAAATSAAVEGGEDGDGAAEGDAPEGSIDHALRHRFRRGRLSSRSTAPARPTSIATDRIGEPMARQGGKIMTSRHRANRRGFYGVSCGRAIGERAPPRLGPAVAHQAGRTRACCAQL